MKILFINPPRHNGLPVIREDRCEIVNRYLVNPPYSLMLLASSLRKQGHEVGIIDANCENLSYGAVGARIKTFAPQMTIFRFTPASSANDIKTADVVKSVCPDSLVVTLCWSLKWVAEDILKRYKNIDVYVKGEYHYYGTIIKDLIKALNGKRSLEKVANITFRKGSRIISTARKAQEDPSACGNIYEHPLPAYDLIPPLSRYYISPKYYRHTPFTIMYASAGCPNKCIYCVVSKTKWKVRTLKSIKTEIDHLKRTQGLRCIFFMDEFFTLDRKRVIGLCEHMIKNKMDITWYASTRVDKVDAKMLALMREAGCRALSFGIESGSQKIVDNAKKGFNVEQALKTIKMVKEAGILVHLSMIIGLPGENQQTVDETIKFVKQACPSMAQFNVAVPYPGTELYDLAQKKGWLKRNIDYSDLQHHTCLSRTLEMTTDEILKARMRAYRALYFSPRWIISQFTNFKDVSFTVKYYIKCMGMYFVNRMKNSH